MPESQRVSLPALTDSQQAWWLVVFAETVMSSLGRWCTAIEITWPCFCLVNRGRARRIGRDAESWSDDWKKKKKTTTLLWHTPYKCHTFTSLQTKSRLAYAETVVPPPNLFVGMNSDYTDQTWQEVFRFIDHQLGPASPPRAPNPNYKHVANKSLYLNDMQLLSSSPCTAAFFSISAHILLPNRCFCSY